MCSELFCAGGRRRDDMDEQGTELQLLRHQRDLHGGVPPPYELQVYGEAALDATWNWDLRGDAVKGFDDTLLPDDAVPFGLIAATIPGVAGVPQDITGVSVNGSMCSYQEAPEEAGTAAIESGIQAVSIRDGKLSGTDGNPLKMKGINYFGFETLGGSMVDGLWISGTSLTGDFATIVYRLKLLGFNAVRLPFSFKNLYGGTATSFTQACQTDDLGTVLQSTTDPSFGYSGPTPEPEYMPPTTRGVCNSYLPNDSVLDRFMFVLDVFARNGIYVMIDNHLNLDTSITDDPDGWVQSWQKLATTISQAPEVSPWVLMDLANEPDSLNLRWEAANGLPSMTKYYLAAMDAIATVIPGQVFLVEGLGQVGQAICWGNGFSTDPSVISSTGISDPTPFFTQLAAKPYLNNVALAPHIYGPSISHDASYSGNALFEVLSRTMGYLNKRGFCVAGDCHVYPIVIGETGSSLADVRDFDFYTSFIQYLTVTGPGDDGLHNSIDSVFWWSWNANSGDTHGLVMDDWTALNFQKVQLLQHLQGLSPFYAPTPPLPTSDLNRGMGGVSTQSFDGTVTLPAAEPFAPTPLRGFVLPLRDLIQNNATARGDLPTLLQRMKGLGFSGVQVAFDHDGFELTHPCEVSGPDVLLDGVFAVADSLSRGALPNVTSLPRAGDPRCNAFAEGLAWPQQLGEVVSLIERNGMLALLQDTDGGLAVRDPTTWLTDWAQVGAALHGKSSNRTLLSFVGHDPASQTQGGMTWRSAGMPGLGELVFAGMRTVSRILTDVQFVVEGVDGDDFEDSDTFFRGALGAGFSSDLVIYSSGLPQQDSEQFLKLGTTGFCLTQASCQLLPLVQVLEPLEGNGTSPSNSTRGWFARLADPTNVTLDEVKSLTAEGLQPWFKAQTAYNYIPGPIVGSAAEVQSAETTACNVTVGVVAESDPGPPSHTMGLQLTVTNLLPTTIQPPWDLGLIWPDLTQVVKAYGFSALTSGATSGSVNLTNDGVADTLWPLAHGSVQKLVVLNAASTNVSTLVINVAGQPCSLGFENI